MSGRRHAVVTLHPVYSPDTLPFRSLTFASDEDSISIGRSSKCLSKNLVPAHNNAWFESRVMSRDHARLGIRLEKEIVYVRDNGSMHGTSLNGKKITTGRDVSVHSGDILTFGNEVTRGSETFAPLRVRCECAWFDNNIKEASEPPEKLPSKPFTNSFSVPDDDELVEVVHDTGYKQVTTFTVPDSDDDSEADSAHPKDQSTPATSPLSKDAVDCKREDAESSIPKESQPKPEAYESDRDEGAEKLPVTFDEDQAPVTPTMTPPAAFSPCVFSDNEEWEGDEISSSQEDSESQMSDELEDDEDADASCSSGGSFEEGFASGHTHAANKSYTPPPAAYATTLSTGPCINEWAGPSDADYIPQQRHCRFPNGVFVKGPSSYGYSDGPFMFDNARSSAENVGAMGPVVLPGPSTIVDHRAEQDMHEQQWKELRSYNNSIGKPVLPSFMNLPFFPQCGNVSSNEKTTFGSENTSERRAGESTTTTRVSIADIVHDCKPSEPRASLKRKAAEMELDSVVSVPSYFDQFSELPHCDESIRDDQLESVFGDVASLPDAQPQLPVSGLDSSPPELTKIPAAPEEQSAANTVSDNGPLRKRAKLTHAPSRRSKLARDAAVAFGGVVVGSILTVAGLASLPPDFFTN